jgi:hypothetical protein
MQQMYRIPINISKYLFIQILFFRRLLKELLKKYNSFTKNYSSYRFFDNTEDESFLDFFTALIPYH